MCIFILFLIADLCGLGCQLCPGWPNLNPCCYTSNQDVDSYCHANRRHIGAITLQVVIRNLSTVHVNASPCLFFLCLLFDFFFLSSRSTKLVIIERLLLLAERYVITIEVGPEFISDFTCMALLIHSLLMLIISQSSGKCSLADSGCLKGRGRKDILVMLY